MTVVTKTRVTTLMEFNAPPCFFLFLSPVALVVRDRAWILMSCEFNEEHIKPIFPNYNSIKIKQRNHPRG